VTTLTIRVLRRDVAPLGRASLLSLMAGRRRLNCYSDDTRLPPCMRQLRASRPRQSIEVARPTTLDEALAARPREPVHTDGGQPPLSQAPLRATRPGPALGHGNECDGLGPQKK
jgi:hypothetical protein